MAQQRYRQRQKEKTESVQQQLQTLNRRLARLELERESLSERHRILSRLAQMADTKSGNPNRQVVSIVILKMFPSAGDASNFHLSMSFHRNSYQTISHGSFPPFPEAQTHQPCHTLRHTLGHLGPCLAGPKESIALIAAIALP